MTLLANLYIDSCLIASLMNLR